jgi:DNA-binding NarL/FixJ family response regulator
MPIRVIVIEDHPLMLKAIVDVLNSHGGIQVADTANHGSELPRLVREVSPDVVILDLGMSTGNFEPISAIQSVMEANPSLRILVLTGYDDEILVKAIIAAGVLGYVLKSDDLSLQLPLGVERVYLGKRFFSPDVVDKYFALQKYEDVELNDQELGVLRLVSQGYANTRIARTMGISEKRVSAVLTNIYTKLDVHETKETNVRVAAINKARELGLLSSEQQNTRPIPRS